MLGEPGTLQTRLRAAPDPPAPVVQVSLTETGREVATPPIAAVPEIMVRVLNPARSSCTEGAEALMPTVEVMTVR